MKKWQEECNYRRIKDSAGTVIANIIMIDGQNISVSNEVYEAYSQMGRQSRYQDEMRKKIPHVSLDKLADACVPIEEYMLEQSPSPEDICISREEQAEQERLLRLLPEAMKQLTDSEQEFIQALFFEGVTVREYARRTGVYHRAVIYQRDKLLKKLQVIFKKMM